EGGARVHGENLIFARAIHSDALSAAINRQTAGRAVRDCGKGAGKHERTAETEVDGVGGVSGRGAPATRDTGAVRRSDRITQAAAAHSGGVVQSADRDGRGAPERRQRQQQRSDQRHREDAPRLSDSAINCSAHDTPPPNPRRLFKPFLPPPRPRPAAATQPDLRGAALVRRNLDSSASLQGTRWPEWVQQVREDAERALARGGWSCGELNQ